MFKEVIGEQGERKERIHPPKIFVFIDGPYLSKAVNALGLRERNMDLDFQKMLGYLADPKKSELVGACYYSGLSFSASAQPFFQKLKNFGYEVIVGEENPVTGKVAPVDHQLLTDLCLDKDNYDIATVVSGDGDFAYAIESLVIRFGKKVNIVATRSNISTNLLALANRYPSQVRILFLEEHYQWFTMRRVLKNGKKNTGK